MRKPGSGSKTGKLTKEEVAQFKAEMYSDTLRNLQKKYNKVTERTLCGIRSGEIWPNIEPAKRGKF